MKSARAVIADAAILVNECRDAMHTAGGISSLLPYAPSYGVAKCPNDVLLFTFQNSEYVPPSMPQLLGLARFIIGKDNDAVFKILIKGRNPIIRHVPRTQRVDTDFVHEVMKDNSVYALYINTRIKFVDMFTKGIFVTQWKALCDMAQV